MRKPQGLGMLAILLIAIPFEEITIPGLPLEVPLSLVIATLMAVYGVLGRKLTRTGLEAPVILYLLVIILSMLQTYIFKDLAPDEEFWGYGMRGSQFRGWYQLGYFIAGFAACSVVVSRLRTWAQYDLAIKITLRVFIAINLFALYEVIAKTFDLPLVSLSTTSPWYRSDSAVSFGSFDIPRAYATFIEPGAYGFYLLSILFICLVSIKAKAPRPGPPTSALTGASAASGVLGLLLTFSTSAIGSFTVVLAFIISRLRKGLKLAFWGAACLVLLGYLSTAALQAAMADLAAEQDKKVVRFLGLEEGRYGEIIFNMRQRGRELALEKVADAPILGIGFGNEIFYTRMPEVHELAFGSFSLPITVLLETGLLGLLAFTFVLAKVLREAYRIAKNQSLNPAYRRYGLGLGAGILATMIHHSLYGGGRLLLLEWVMIGFVMAASRLSKAGPPGMDSRHEQPS